MGRLRAASVVDSEGTRESILEALEKAMHIEAGNVTNPYGDGHSAPRILDAIRTLQDDRERMLAKRFSDFQ